MREVGVDGLFTAPQLEFALDEYNIYSQCEKRLLDVELDLSNSATTFKAVQWAIYELQRMELQERYFVAGNYIDEEERADPAGAGAAPLVRSSSEEQGDGTEGAVPDRSPSRYDMEITQDPVPETRTAIRGEGENLDENRTDNPDAAPSAAPKHLTDDPAKGGVRNWRHIFKATSKRKCDEEESGRDGGKRAKVLNHPSVAADPVFEDDHGEAGKRMADRISARLAVPETVYLTNLVSHCLLVSMDQVLTSSVEDVLGAVSLDMTEERSRGTLSKPISVAVSAAPAREAREGSDNDWLWLHKWLVKTVLSDVGDDCRFASLDWLIAFITAARQSLIKPILDDLAADLQKRETEGSGTLTSYMRRTGVLEYAALRDPERIFGSLRPLFPPTVFPATTTGSGGGDEGRPPHGINELWHGWLTLMILCPRLFCAFSRFWIPTLCVEDVKSWRLKPAPASLSQIWTPFVNAGSEEPKTTREVLLAAVMRRLPELAPVAYDFVVLLSRLDEASADLGSSEDLLIYGNYVLASIYRELSMTMLPKRLGGRDFSNEGIPDSKRMKGESGGIATFVANLKQHAHVLWKKALDDYSTSRCTCCEMPNKEEMQLESSSRTRAGAEGLEGSGEGSAAKGGHESGLEVQKGCLYNDPLIRLCLLTLLSCPDQVVADLLANDSLVQPSPAGSFDPQSLKRLVMVMRMMRIVSGQGRGSLILELWAQQMVDRTLAASDDQALQRVLAMRQLLDLDFWQSYHTLLGPLPQSASAVPIVGAEDERGHQGLSWKVVWKGLHKVLDVQWLLILPLMHREVAWELRLAVLRVLQLLNQDGTTRPQAVADRLKGALGLFFSWLEVYDGCDDNVTVRQSDKTGPFVKPSWIWSCVRAKEHLKSIVIELASSSFPSFTLMINSLLDFSFEHSKQTFSGPSPPSSAGQLARADASSRKGVGGSASLFCMAPLSTGKLDRYGRLELLSGSVSERDSGARLLQMVDAQLTEENHRIQSDVSTPLPTSERERGASQLRHLVSQNAAAAVSSSERLDEDLMKSQVLDAELASLLHRTFQRACAKSVELLDEWPCHPGNVLATHMADRLETPHEVPMTMEQYEEVLPKHISSIRHIFLTDCFSQNPLLMEMVELIVRHGGSRAILRCVEFVRVLLADSIARWHAAFRTRWPQLVTQKLGEVEAWNRIQVSRLIQLVASANWLPLSLAASGEIVAVIDGADIADLLLLVWRCMHHAMAFGPKAWEESSSNLRAAGGLLEGQALTSTTATGVDEEAAKEGTYTEWETHFFAILRRNITKIGANFPQVYPIRKAF